MRSIFRPAIVAALVLFVAGCASTRVSVEKVALRKGEPSREPAGIRYSLPKPFLLVTPNTNGDGGFKAEVIYLPDENQTYAIDASTRRGKYSLNVQVKDGLLAKIAWAGTDAAVAAESTRVAGELAKAQLELEQKERDKRDDGAKAQAKAADEERSKREADLESKELDLQLAQAELEIAEEAAGATPTPEARTAVRAAQLKVRQATIRRDAARAKLEAATRAEAAAGDNAFNEPTTAGGKAAQPPRAKFWGPVLYAIEDDGTTVSLRAVEWRPDRLKQVPFLTVPASAVKPPEAPKLRDDAEVAFTWPSGTQSHTITLPLTADIKSVTTGGRQLWRIVDGKLVPIAPPLFNAALQASGTAIEITFTSTLQPGQYQLLVPFVWGDKQDGSVSPRIRVDGQ